MFRQLKQLWREWGQGVDKDYLTAEEFWLALRKLGIELTQEDGEAMMRKFASEKDCIKFEEFVIHFLALPNNFFSQQHVKSETLMNKSAVQERQQIQLGAKLPKGTSLEAAPQARATSQHQPQNRPPVLAHAQTSIRKAKTEDDKRKTDARFSDVAQAIDRKFRIQLRKELFNIQRVLFIVMKSPYAATKYMTKAELYNVFAGLGIMCTQAPEAQNTHTHTHTHARTHAHRQTPSTRAVEPAARAR